MRDPKRINRFCDGLKAIWSMSPDLRFGQLMLIMLMAYEKDAGKDPFFVEDDEMLEFMRNYLRHINVIQ